MHILRLVILAAGLIPALAAGEDTWTDRVDLSGFARLIGGIVNDEHVSFEGYDDSGSFSNQSLFALQADVQFNDRLSLGAQLLAHSDETRENGFEWLYLSYEPTNNLTLKAGRLRTPFVNYSDVIDVGFAYPWISAPIPIYSSYLFTQYEGASIGYHFDMKDSSLDVEAYWGSDDFDVSASGFVTPVKVDDLYGIVMIFHRGNFMARASYHDANSVRTPVPEIADLRNTLAGSGFTQTADSLRLQGDANATHFGTRYDSLSYFFEAEWLRIETDLSVSPSELTNYYAMIGKNLVPFQFHLTAGRSQSKEIRPVDEIPPGVDPFLDILRDNYRTLLQQVPSDDIDYVATGIRYDVNANVALKAEVTWAEQRSDSQFFEVEDGADFDGRTILFQLGLEWVF